MPLSFKPGLSGSELQPCFARGKLLDDGIVVTKAFDAKTDEWTHLSRSDNNPPR
jgi:hypothetical protein